MRLYSSQGLSPQVGASLLVQYIMPQEGHFRWTKPWSEKKPNWKSTCTTGRALPSTYLTNVATGRTGGGGAGRSGVVGAEGRSKWRSSRLTALGDRVD